MTRRGRDLARQQNARGRDLYARAAERQAEERLLATARPVPARITIALDMCGLEGPEVDIACGAVEPAVDNWEAGIEVPSAEQVRLLAKLCDLPVRYFYEPADELVIEGPVFICDRTKRVHGLTLAHARVDDRGVLQRQFVQPSRGERFDPGWSS